jgi:replicative DNA helicase
MNQLPDQLAGVPLHDISLEQELLGALLLRNDDFDVVAALQPDHFYEPLHRALFDEMRRKFTRGEPATPLTVRGALPNPLEVAGVTAEQYLARLAQLAAPSAHVPHFADLVMHYAAAREYVFNTQELVGACTAGTPIDEAVRVFRDTLEVISSGSLGHGLRDTSASPAEVMDAGIARMTAAVNDDPKAGVIPTGLDELDEVIGGLRRGSLVVVAGRPGMGKSTFMVSTARQIAASGYGVGILSMEMDQPSLALRMMADHVFPRERIAYSAAETGRRITVPEQETLVEAKYEIQEMPFECDFARRLTVAEVRGVARKMDAKLRKKAQKMDAKLRKKGASLDVLFIDYLKFISATDHYRGQRHYEIGEITAALRQLAMELNVCVVLLCQLNREVEKLDDRRPRLDHLRESGDIEQDADAVLLLYRDAYYLRMAAADPAKKADAELRLSQVKFDLEINIAKQRQGPTRTVTVFCDVATSAIRSPRP